MKKSLILFAVLLGMSASAFTQNIEINLFTGKLTLAAQLQDITGDVGLVSQFALVDPYNFVILQELATRDASIILTTPLVLSTNTTYYYQIIGISSQGNLVAISDVFEFTPPAVEIHSLQAQQHNGEISFTASVQPWVNCSIEPEQMYFSIIDGGVTDEKSERINAWQSPNDGLIKGIARQYWDQGNYYYGVTGRFGDISFHSDLGSLLISKNQATLVMNGRGYGMWIYTDNGTPLHLSFYTMSGQLLYTIHNYSPGETFWLPEDLPQDYYVLSAEDSNNCYSFKIVNPR